MNKKYILSIDQGTTSCRAIVFDTDMNEIAVSQIDITQLYPKVGWVEHDANEIWDKQLECCQNVIANAKIDVEHILTIGITNQRETIVAWNKNTGIPIYNAIVWQDKRTSESIELDKKQLSHSYNNKKTGLNLDAYFSAPKMRWLIDKIPEAEELIKKNKLCIGTIDSWLIWKLTQGNMFCTDYSNASRTNLFNINTLQWDKDLLDYYKIPIEILPQVVESIGYVAQVHASHFGNKIPISAIAGDQQAALFGHACFKKGEMKITLGTGGFLLQNIGNEPIVSDNGLLTTIGWKSKNEIVYAIEGSVFHVGSALKWLKEEMEILKNYEEIDEICSTVVENEHVLFVPAFTGLGAPFWNQNARGMIIGLTRDSSKAQLVKATIDSIGYQIKAVLDEMSNEVKEKIKTIKIDGGVSKSDTLMQFIADISQHTIYRSNSSECTAKGIAMMAYSAYYNLENKDENQLYTIFRPQMSIAQREKKYTVWKDAVARSLNWVK